LAACENGKHWVQLLQGVPKNAPIKQTKMVKHVRLVNIPKGSKSVQNG